MSLTNWWTIISPRCTLQFLYSWQDVFSINYHRNWTRYPISEHDFRASYLSLCAQGTTLNPNSLRFLPLLFAVLSIACKLAPEHMAGDAQTRRLTSSRYYWCCKCCKFNDPHSRRIDFTSSTAIIIDCCGYTPRLFRNGHYAHAGESLFDLTHVTMKMLTYAF